MNTVTKAYMALLLAGLLCCRTAVAAETESGLVLHYTFDEVSNGVVRDRSDRQNHGKVFGGGKRVQGGPYGYALDFDGKDDYVEVDASEGFEALELAGTISVWFWPRVLQGGLAAWQAGSGDLANMSLDNRLVLLIDTRYAIDSVTGMISSGESLNGVGKLHDRYGPQFGDLRRDEWAHVVLAYDAKRVALYRDGLYQGSVRARAERHSGGIGPEITGVPLRLGHSRGQVADGLEFFDGLMGEVRMYNRRLSDEEILDIYEEGVKAGAGHVAPLECLGKARMEVRPYRLREKIGVEADLSPMRLPEEASVRVALFDPGKPIPIREERFPAVRGETEVAVDAPFDLAPRIEVIFDAPFDLAPGTYRVEVAAFDGGGEPIGAPTSRSFTWTERPAAFKGVTILNNLVWELLRVCEDGERQISLPAEYSFSNPEDGWVYIRVATGNAGAKVRVMLDSKDRQKAISMQPGPQVGSLEAMRLLPAGEHMIRMEAEAGGAVSELVVRRVPTICFTYLPGGPYDWEFLWPNTLRNVNVLVHAHGDQPDGPKYIKKWTEMGRAYLHAGHVRGTYGRTGEEVYNIWGFSTAADSANRGPTPGMPKLEDPLFVDSMKGLMVDELHGRDSNYDGWLGAVERLTANPAFRGKWFVAYTTNEGGASPRMKKFWNTVFKTGGFVAPEIYMSDAIGSTEAEAAKRVRDKIARDVNSWTDTFPGSIGHIIVALGSFSTGNLTLNVNPAANYNVFQDMQMQTLATHPALFGLGGVNHWVSYRCDQDYLRWIGRLYRHYGIEGQTERLTRDPYRLTHISNPDFANGVEGWTLSPAEPGSIAAGALAGISQGRYAALDMVGDTYLWTKRSAARPNRFSQEVRRLNPGRLYSLKVYTTDFQHCKEQKEGSPPDYEVAIDLENVEVLTAKDKTFRAHYHHKVFRAKGETARLTISDWRSDGKPGGPIGQELIYNFIEIEPYLEPCLDN